MPGFECDQIMDTINGPIAGSKGSKKAAKGGKQLKDVTRAVSKLAAGTSKALDTLDKRVSATKNPDAASAGDIKKILKQMDDLATQFSVDDSDLERDDPDAAKGV